MAAALHAARPRHGGRGRCMAGARHHMCVLQRVRGLRPCSGVSTSACISRHLSPTAPPAGARTPLMHTQKCKCSSQVSARQQDTPKLHQAHPPSRSIPSTLSPPTLTPPSPVNVWSLFSSLWPRWAHACAFQSARKWRESRNQPTTTSL